MEPRRDGDADIAAPDAGEAKRRNAGILHWARRHERALLPLGLTLALAAYYLTPSPALSLLWLALVAALAWRSPRVALALLPLTFPFWFVPKRVVGYLVFPLSEIALALYAVVILGRGCWRLARAPMLLRRRRPRRAALALLARVGPATALGGALLLIGMSLGVVIARRPQDALRAWRWEIAEPLVYLLLAVWYLRGRRWARLTLWSLIGSGLLVAALATAQTLGWHVTFTPVAVGARLVAYPPAPTGPYRATAIIYGSGNSAGAWLERALPLALAIALLGRGLARLERWLAGMATLALLPALLWSDSRGAWLGAAAGMGLIALVWVWRALTTNAAARRRLALIALVGMATLALGWALWGATLLRAVSAGHSDTGAVRLLLWQSALRMLHDHPLLGVGPDQFLYYYDPAYTSHPYLISHLNGRPTIAVNQPDFAHPHNLILDLWLSAGLLGLVGYGIIVIALTRRALHLARVAGGQAWRPVVAVGVLGMLLASLTHGMVDSAYFQPDLALAFWWGVAALGALDLAPGRRRRTG